MKNRADLFEEVWCDSCDFMELGAEIVKKPLGFERFRRARAAQKRMCPAWHYLTGIVGLAGARPLLKKFDAREKLLARARLT